jgi:hypothetical protein
MLGFSGILFGFPRHPFAYMIDVIYGTLFTYFLKKAP